MRVGDSTRSGSLRRDDSWKLTGERAIGDSGSWRLEGLSASSLGERLGCSAVGVSAGRRICSGDLGGTSASSNESSAGFVMPGACQQRVATGPEMFDASPTM
uniref:Uncharacterized protein n=1 Tax=Alexandrium catenella TaxID=2925 RepID=A0A7S1QL85_ALECA